MGFVDIYEAEKPVVNKLSYRERLKRSIFVRAIFAFIWRNRLYDIQKDGFGSVVKVTSWRSALIDWPSTSRQHVLFLPKWVFWDPKL